MIRKALSLVLAAGLALSALPVGAQDFGPNTIWGEVPGGITNAANAILQDGSGRAIATVPVIDGKFAFRDVVPGQYVVVLQDGAGRALATSEGISFASGATTRALFGATRVPAAVVPAGGGLSTTAWVLIGAAAVGVTTAIVIATNNDQGTASPSR
jgi:hypothetical protein